MLIKGSPDADYVLFAIGLAVSAILGALANVMWYIVVFKKNKNIQN